MKETEKNIIDICQVAMKIVQFIAENTLSGGTRHTIDLSCGLAERGHEVILVMPKGAFSKMPNFRHLPLVSQSRWEQIKEVRKFLKDFISHHQNEKIIFHCHGIRGGLVGRLAARVLKIPIVYTEHLWTIDYHLKNPLREKFQLAILRWLDKFTTHTIAVSKAVRDFLRQQKIASAPKISVVYNGVFVPLRPSSLITYHSSPIIGSLGMNNYIKDFATLRRAFEIVKKDFPDAELKIAREEKSLDAFYRSLTIYVQSSLSESFGLAVAEAMSYGLPVVATNVGGLKELVKNGKTGILVEPRQPPALAAAIIKLLKNENLRRTAGEAGRERIKTCFNREKMIKKTEKIYEKVVSTISVA